MTNERRLVRDFNFIILYEVSQSVLLWRYSNRYIRKQRNKFSNLSALVAQTFCVRALLGSFLVLDHG